jgi:5-methylcytosine-specific restriction endonuclease McrA
VGIWIFIAVIAVLAFLAMSSFSHRSWRSRVPEAERYAKERPASTSLRTQLRRDVNAGFSFDPWRFLWRRDERYWFQGTGCPPRAVKSEDYARMRHAQEDGPVLVATSGERQYWWWNDEFFWDNGHYSSEDVRAVVLKNQRQNRQRVEQARTSLALDQDPARHRRDAIPEDVRRFVFQRDEGECQKCGSRELLQFDHIIPVALGGSSEPENLQLLCSTCNREKSARL